MAIELEKVIAYTGIEAETTEDFLEKFGKKFLTEDQIFKDKEVKDRVFGRVLGSVTTGIKQIFDEDGIQLSGDDLKQPVEAVAKLGFQRMKEKFAAEKAELEKTAGLTADEKLRELSANLLTVQNKNKDYDRLLKEKAAEFEGLVANNKNELKKFKLGSIHKDVQGAIQWNPEKDEYSKVGFLTKMSEKFQIDLDENDEPFIVDKATNSRIKAEGSHSTFMTPAEVYKQEAIKAGLAAVNKKAGTPAPVGSPKPITTPSPANPVSKRPMANTRWQPEA